MQPVETPHDREVGVRHRTWQKNTATADVQDFVLLVIDRSCAGSIIALRSTNLLCRALLPKLFSSVSSPILAWSDFTSTTGCAVPLPPPGPNTSAAPSSSCAFHDVI